MGIINMIMDCQRPRPSTDFIKFPLFSVIAALSERIMSLDATVSRCINKLDLSALRTKLAKARDMFMVNDHDGKVTARAFHRSLFFIPSFQ